MPSEGWRVLGPLHLSAREGCWAWGGPGRGELARGQGTAEAGLGGFPPLSWAQDINNMRSTASLRMWPWTLLHVGLEREALSTVLLLFP